MGVPESLLMQYCQQCTVVVVIGTCSSSLSCPTVEGLSLVCDRGWLEAEVLQNSLFLQKSKAPTVKISMPLSSYLWKKWDKALSYFPLKTQGSRSSLFQVAKTCHAITFLCTPLSFLLCRYLNKVLHMKIFVEKKIGQKIVLSLLKVGLFSNELFADYFPTFLWAPILRKSSVPIILNCIYPSKHF